MSVCTGLCIKFLVTSPSLYRCNPAACCEESSEWAHLEESSESDQDDDEDEDKDEVDQVGKSDPYAAMCTHTSQASVNNVPSTGYQWEQG